MRKRVQLAGAVALLAVLGVVGAAVAGGGGDRIKEHLTGYEETPLTLSTPANGEFKARISRFSEEIEYRLTYRDFETPVLQAHIHLGARATSGGISAFLCTNLGNGPAGRVVPACPTPGGTVRGTIEPADVIGPSGQGIALGEFDEFVDAIRAGVTYANVHSTARPAGEIRAQLEDDRDHD